jgi:hypothetical protein
VVSSAASRFRPRTKLVISCPPALRLHAMLLAARRGVTVSQLAQAAVFLFDVATLATIADPGEGLSRLALSLRGQFDPATVRRALQYAVQEALLRDSHASMGKEIEELRANVEILRDGIKKLMFNPVTGGVRRSGDAARILGLTLDSKLDEMAINRRFRELAPLYHPDTGVVGGSVHMAQLIDARRVLLRHLRDGGADG